MCPGYVHWDPIWETEGSCCPCWLHLHWVSCSRASCWFQLDVSTPLWFPWLQPCSLQSMAPHWSCLPRQGVVGGSQALFQPVLVTAGSARAQSAPPGQAGGSVCVSLLSGKWKTVLKIVLIMLVSLYYHEFSKYKFQASHDILGKDFFLTCRLQRCPALFPVFSTTVLGPHDTSGDSKSVQLLFLVDVSHSTPAALFCEYYTNVQKWTEFSGSLSFYWASRGMIKLMGNSRGYISIFCWWQLVCVHRCVCVCVCNNCQ